MHNKNNIEIQHLEQLAAVLASGDSSSGNICPFCKGGKNGDKSFSITKKEDGTILYICHRAKCGRKGILGNNGSPHLRVFQKKREYAQFKKPTKALTRAQYMYFATHYGITSEEIQRAGFLYVPEYVGVLQPVFGPEQYERGLVVRRYGAHKRVWTFRDPRFLDEPMQAWYVPPDKKRDVCEGVVVIVEDQLSAIKLSRYYNSVALLTNTISKLGVLELCKYSKVQYIALDKDAIAEAENIRTRYASVLNLTIVPVDRDPKYWNDEELKTLRGTISGRTAEKVK